MSRCPSVAGPFEPHKRRMRCRNDTKGHPIPHVGWVNSCWDRRITGEMGNTDSNHYWNDAGEPTDQFGFTLADRDRREREYLASKVEVTYL